MEGIIDAVYGITQVGFMLYLQITFYLSFKRCFENNSKKKVKLFLITLISNPVLCYFFAASIGTVVFGLISGLSKFNSDWSDLGFIVLFGCLVAVFYFMLIMMFTAILSKFLKEKNKAQVLFLYLMFSAIGINFFRDTGSGTFYSIPYMGKIIDMIGAFILFGALLIFYRSDVISLSKLAMEKVKVNWKVFLFPPLIFTLIYSVFSFTVLMNEGYNNKDKRNDNLILAVYIFSTIIVFLLIWAFYVIIRNLTAASEIKTLSVEVMEALAHTIDAKDEYTRGHSVRVAKYSRMIAEKMGLSSEECEDVYYMGLLHDIGKIGVPNSIINSPTRLTDEEFAVIKTHPSVGYDILAEIKSRPDLSIGARWHHERYDGKGYPDGKQGNEIPKFARIIAVADSYDAMTSNRSYRKYMPQDKVRDEIEKNEDTQFDPEVAKCMLKIIDEDVNYELHE